MWVCLWPRIRHFLKSPYRPLISEVVIILIEKDNSRTHYSLLSPRGQRRTRNGSATQQPPTPPHEIDATRRAATREPACVARPAAPCARSVPRAIYSSGVGVGLCRDRAIIGFVRTHTDTRMPAILWSVPISSMSRIVDLSVRYDPLGRQNAEDPPPRSQAVPVCRSLVTPGGGGAPINKRQRGL